MQQHMTQQEQTQQLHLISSSMEESVGNSM